MKRIFYLLFPVLVSGLGSLANAQVTNLTINGSPLSFTVVSGDNFGWEYNIPTGGTASCDVWIDVNHNGSIEPGIDKPYLSFDQTDGDTTGHGGPPDMDWTANGHVIFQSRLGLAPGTFIMSFRHNGAGMGIAGTVTPLASPVHTLSGHISVPLGRSAQYIVLQAERSNKELSPPFWNAITDVNGDFAIQMDADTAGNPWWVSIAANPFPPAVITPDRMPVTVLGNHSGLNFNIAQAAAQVAGYVREEGGNPVVRMDVQISRDDGSVWRSARTDGSGFYQVGLLAGELLSQTWRIQTNNIDGQFTTTSLVGQRQLPVIQGGDSLFRQLVIYAANSQIQGQVRVNGNPPGFPMTMVAYNQDTAEAVAGVDGGTGNFTIGVSNHIYNYQLFPINLPPNYFWSQMVVHPGATGVIFDITLTSVGPTGSDLPQEFALRQNYPNPFNPSTTIGYELPRMSHVTLTIFNTLGQEVARLVDAQQGAGYHEVKLENRDLGSGVYFYRLVAGDFVATRKLLMLK